MLNSSSQANFVLRAVERRDLKQIVTVHCASFEGFFLTSLGPNFLKNMYQAFLNHNNSICVVLESEGRVVGFAFGVDRNFSFSKSISFLDKIFLALALIPILLSKFNVVMTKVISRYTATDTSLSVPEGTLFLKSIGLEPSLHGSGYAKKLLHFFEAHASEGGYTDIMLTTDADSNDRVINFYRKCAYSEIGTITQDSKRKMLVLSKMIRKMV